MSEIVIAAYFKDKNRIKELLKNSLFWRIVFAVTTPVLCYIVAEVLQSGADFLTAVPFGYVLLNIGFYAGAYLLLLSILRSTKIASTILSVGVFAFLTVNYYAVLWRTIPVTWGDLKCAMTAGSILYGYNFVLPKRIIIAAVIVLVHIAVLMIAKTRNGKNSIKVKLARSCAGAVAAVALIGILYGITSPKLNVVGPGGVSFQRYGYIVSFVANAKSMNIKKPKGYSAQLPSEILGDYDNEEETEIYPNIIVIMNESFSDLQTVGRFETNEDYLKNFRKLKEESVSGQVLTFGLGGGTSLSEFELLTRSSQVLLPYTSVAYMQYINQEIPTLATTLKNCEVPYDTTAMHPAQAINYNRDKNYPLMGFNRFLDKNYFDDLESPRGFLDDRQCYGRMMEYFYSTDENTPQFIFNITIQNHGGYFDDCDIGVEPVEITSFDSTYDAERYLTLVKQSDEALGELFVELSQCERPVVVLMFGDHQPLLEDEFYESLRGDMDNWDGEDHLSRHITPFMIWSNYGNIEEKDVGLTSLNYLSSILLDSADMPLTPYDEFLLDMREDIPAMNGCMYYTSDGVLHEKGDEENEWLDKYAVLQYGAVFDSENIELAGYDFSN